jgi:CRISPR-associated endoribonuclease Cas6
MHSDTMALLCESISPAGHSHPPLYTFSPLRANRRRANGDRLRLGPGHAEWLISSPSAGFIQSLAALLSRQSVLAFGDRALSPHKLEVVPPPMQFNRCSFSCASPIIVSQPRGSGYLLPGDPDFHVAICQRLIDKYTMVHGVPPADSQIRISFDASYQQTRRFTKRISFRGEYVSGAFCPFIIEGSPDLIALGYESGFGDLNESGFGMVI